MVGWESADRLDEVEAGREGRKLRLREESKGGKKGRKVREAMDTVFHSRQS